MSDNASAQNPTEQSDYAALLTERELYNIPKSFALEILEEVAYEAADEDETETQAILSRAAAHRDQYLLACQNMLTRHLDGIMQDTLHKAAQDFVKKHS